MKISAKKIVALPVCLFTLLILSACINKADTAGKSRAQEVDEQLHYQAHLCGDCAERSKTK